MRKMMIAATALLALAAGSAMAQNAGSEADHEALRQLKEKAVKVVNERDYQLAQEVLHKPFIATLVTQDSFKDFDVLKAHFEQLYTRDTLRMKKITLSAEADEEAQIYEGTFAIARGSTKERYELADGRSFDIDGRWTAVTMKNDDDWKILALHFGANFLDNPVISAIEQAAKWTAVIGLAIGLIVGFLAGWFLKRRRLTA